MLDQNSIVATEALAMCQSQQTCHSALISNLIKLKGTATLTKLGERVPQGFQICFV